MSEHRMELLRAEFVRDEIAQRSPLDRALAGERNIMWAELEFLPPRGWAEYRCRTCGAEVRLGDMSALPEALLSCPQAGSRTSAGG